MKVAQLMGRLDAELFDERAANFLVGLQRFRLPSRAIEREHELSPEALTQRVLPDQRLELGDNHRVATTGEIRLDARLDGPRPELVETRDLGLREGLVGKVGEGCTPPERERLDVLGGRNEALEAVEVELIGFDPQRVTR